MLLSKTLLKEGNADANQANIDGVTALVHASIHGSDASTKTLIKEGNAKVNKTDNDGRTALMYASRLGHNVMSLSRR